MNVPAWLLAYRKSEWFRLTYLLLLSLMVAALVPSAGGSAVCLVFLLMPVTMFVIPYWLGERKVKRLGVNGGVVFAASTVLVALILTQTVLTTPPFELSSEGMAGSHSSMQLTNGTVTPFRAGQGGHFNFTVQLTTVNASTPDRFTVYLLVLVVQPLDVVPRSPVAMTPIQGNQTQTGVRYATEQDLGADVYGYAFNVTDNRGNWSFTLAAYGPITAGWGSFYGVFLVYSASYLVLPVLFYFFFIFMWWYSVRSRETRRKMLERAGAEPADGKKAASRARAGKIAEFTCTSCGADVSDDDVKCPKCGAVFED